MMNLQVFKFPTLAAAWLTAALALAGCGEPSSPHLKAGDPALPFKLAALDGGEMSFPEDTRGKVVALRFWADWCPFCYEEMRAIEPVYQTYKDDLVVLAVNVGQDRERVDAFVKKLGISYTALLDEESEIAQRYHVIGLPMTLFIDRDGVVQGKILGESAPGVFAQTVERLLDSGTEGAQ